MERERRTKTAPPLAVPPAAEPPRISAEPAEELEAHPADPVDHQPEISLQVREPGRYQVIVEHGRGGVGRVLRATDRELGRDVAVKELLHRTPLSESRFLREAIITSRLEHPNIVPVHEAGRWPDGTPFYAMKLVSGRPLTALIDEARTYADRLTLLDRVLAVADAIAYAHVRGVIHRDLKPSNVIVGDYGETIVIDWGLAKQVSDPDDQGRLSDLGSELLKAERTKTGAILGTPAYMAPEQGFGGAITKRTDVYALGAILLDVLAGRAQVASESADPFASTDRRSPSDTGTGRREIDGRIPVALRSIVGRAMAMSPWNRYADAKEFGDDLRRFLAGKLVAAHRYTRGELVGRWLGSHRRLVQGSAAVLVALLAASVWFLAREASLRGEAEVARRAADQARRSAESERDRADRQTIALLEQQGRAELAAAHPFRAAPILAEAYRRDPGNVRVQWLLTDALRALLPGSYQNQPLIYSVSISPDDSELLIGYRHEVWAARALPGQQALPGQHGSVFAKYLGNGNRIVTADDGEYGRRRLRIWNATSGEIESSSPIGAPLAAGRACVRGAFDWNPNCDLAVTADGSRIALLGRDGRPRILEAASGRIELVLDIPRGERIWDLSFSADGHRLAGASDRSTVHVWSADNGSVSDVIHGDPKKGWFVSVEFSPDGSQLLTASLWASVSVWDSTTGQLLHELPDSPGTIVAYSRDGRRMFTGGLGDRASRIWESNSGKLVTELEADGAIMAANFSPDGSLVAGLNEHGQITIWDATMGAELRSIGGPTESSLPSFNTPVLTGSVEFSPDGKHLLGTGPNYALIWDVELDTPSPALVDVVVASKSPWRLVDGRLVLRNP